VGPAQTSVSDHNYYVSFIDTYSRFTWISLIKHKSDVFDVFLQFQAHVERLLNHKIIHVQSDGGGEYIKLDAFFHKESLIVFRVVIHINKMVVLSVNIVI